MKEQYLVVVTTSEELQLGVIFHYKLGKLRQGSFNVFCHKQEGLDYISQLVEGPDNSDCDDFIEQILQSKMPEFLGNCDPSKHQLTEQLRELISTEIMPQCI
jgi:hypothetical protein